MDTVLHDLRYAARTRVKSPGFFVIGDPAQLAPLIRAELRQLDPDVPLFNARSLREHLGVLVATERTVSTLVTGFGVLALLLAALGIYGVMSFLVAQRTREIGTRMALGARRGSVLRLVLGRGAALTLVGLVSGLVAALAGTRLMSSLLYGVSATEPAVFGGVAVALVAVAMLACYFPARRATKVDPVKALREE